MCEKLGQGALIFPITSAKTLTHCGTVNLMREAETLGLSWRPEQLTEPSVRFLDYDYERIMRGVKSPHEDAWLGASARASML